MTGEDMKRRECVASMLGLAVTGALAQSSGRYPDKPVRVVVTVPPGGASDFVARAMADSLGRELGAPIIIDNRSPTTPSRIWCPWRRSPNSR